MDRGVSYNNSLSSRNLVSELKNATSNTRSPIKEVSVY
jgi:hypothetical protein